MMMENEMCLEGVIPACEQTSGSSCSASEGGRAVFQGATHLGHALRSVLPRRIERRVQ